MDFRVLLYYWFTQIDDPDSFATEHRALCEQLGLKGRIIIAKEGINGTVSGTSAATEQYQRALTADPRFEGMEFKVDESDRHAFKAMHIRVRPEIITLGVPLVHPVPGNTAPYLDGTAWRDGLHDPNTVVIDTRNTYETEVGHFENAICPPIENFRELPEWLLANKHLLDGKRILTYCTGGIRCEKLTVWMQEVGFQNVYQLQGGIVKYSKDPAVLGEGFEGLNVVFDDRVVTEAGPNSKITTRCARCNALSINYLNCANVDCNLRIILCEKCEEETGRTCCDACAQSERKRIKGAKLRAANA